MNPQLWKPAIDPVAGYVLVAVYMVAAVGTAAHALLHKRDPRAAWGWIAVCWLFPLAGAALYYLFGVNRIETKAQRVFGRELQAQLPPPTPPPPIAGADPVEVRELARLGWAMSGRALLGGNEIQPLHNGNQAYPAMLEAIAGARHTVHLSSYIFCGDAAGQQFADALAQARQRGVQVRVLFDGLGDMVYRPRGSRLLRRHGLKPVLFLPLRLWPPMLHINLRNHRKLLIVDGETAFTGGINIQQGHVADASGEPRIVDLHFRIRGPLAAQLDAVFLADWGFAAGENLPATEPRAEGGDHTSRVITEGPNEDLDRLVMVLIGALATAHRRVWIMTPYFLPPQPLTSALQSAALRGVDVSIIIPQRSDQPWMDWATRHVLPHLLQRQVKVLLRPPPFAHTKLLVVDDWYVQLGSANLDTRSLRLNFELVVESYGKPLAQELAAHFAEVREGCRALKLEDVQERRLPARLRDALCWLFSPYL
jgi:cardiolipin synthase